MDVCLLFSLCNFWMVQWKNNSHSLNIRNNNHSINQMSANSWREFTKTIRMDVRECTKKKKKSERDRKKEKTPPKEHSICHLIINAKRWPQGPLYRLCCRCHRGSLQKWQKPKHAKDCTETCLTKAQGSSVLQKSDVFSVIHIILLIHCLLLANCYCYLVTSLPQPFHALSDIPVVSLNSQ